MFFISSKKLFSFSNLFRNLNSHWSLVSGPFVFDNFVYWKRLGSKEERKLPFLRLFDNPLSKCLTFKIIACNDCSGLFTKIIKGSGTTFCCTFSAWFFYKKFFIWYSTNGQRFNVINFFLLKISNKMFY